MNLPALLTKLLVIALTISIASVQAEAFEPKLRSASALIVDQRSGRILYQKNARDVLPIASITKLMTAMVVLDSKPNMAEMLTITEADVDTLRHSHSRLSVGTRLSRKELLRLTLMSSENRAASALSRSFPGGKPAFVKAMNRKAKAMALQFTHFRDPTGLYAQNVSSALELARMVAAAARYPAIRQYTTTVSHLQTVGSQQLNYKNTNLLIRNSDWRISLSKTGFINEAGRCLVMLAWLKDRPTIIVLLDAQGQLTPVGDSNRIRDWLEQTALAQLLGQG